MIIKQRRYKLYADYERAYRFLQDTYNSRTLNSCLLPAFFEYAHTHSMFNHKLTHRFGLWEDDNGDICAIVCYEWDLGDILISYKSGCEFLLPDLLTYAENELSTVKNGKRSLSVWITDKEAEKSELLRKNGYTRVYSEPIVNFDYNKPFLDAKLSKGFSLVTLADENDIQKINACLWKGFDHGDKPDDDIDCRFQMQSGSHFRPELTLIIKAPDGEYACYLCLWYDEVNKYTYLEPLATIPKYRRMGLATYAVVEGMKKTKALGATRCFTPTNVVALYNAVGFETILKRELWEKHW